MQAGLLLLGATLAEAFLCSGAYRIPLNVNGSAAFCDAVCAYAYAYVARCSFYA